MCDCIKFLCAWMPQANCVHVIGREGATQHTHARVCALTVHLCTCPHAWEDSGKSCLKLRPWPHVSQGWSPCSCVLPNRQTHTQTHTWMCVWVCECERVYAPTKASTHTSRTQLASNSFETPIFVAVDVTIFFVVAPIPTAVVHQILPHRSHTCAQAIL